MVKYSVLRKSDSGADERLGSTGGRYADRGRISVENTGFRENQAVEYPSGIPSDRKG